jgi:hypothetical protein
MTKYWVTDGEGDTLEYEGTPQEAAQEYVDSGNWGEFNETWWIDIHVYDAEACTEEDHVETVTVTVNPETPECDHPGGHVWGTPHAIVGGLKENPGVRGKGGGVEGTNVCALCGLTEHWTNWAQRPDTGEQGLDSVSYDQEPYSTDVVASDDNYAAVDLEGYPFLVDLRAENYCQKYEGNEVEIDGATYVVRDDQWEEKEGE